MTSNCLLVSFLLLSQSMLWSAEDAPQADISDTDSTSKPQIGSKEEFRILFKEKRRQQISAVKTLQSFGRYEQKYEMISNIFNKLFEVEEKAKQAIEDSDYVLGGRLPEEGQTLEALSQVVENCAFFGDVVLRLPDISQRVLTSSPKYESLYKWCISFSMATDLLDKNTQKMFDLLAQELGLVPKSESYVNPYKTNKKSKVKPLEPNGANSKTSNPKNNKIKKPTRKGPRLSKIRTEL